MIAGEEIWIEQINQNQEYDEFFKKIRKKIKNTAKKIQPLKILNPIIHKNPISKAVQKIVPPLVMPSPRPKASSPSIVQESSPTTDDIRAENNAVQEQVLLQKITAHEEKKVDDAIELQEKEAALVQSKIDADYGDHKQLVAVGAIAIVCVIGLAAILVYSKSQNRKNQVEALKVQLAATTLPNP